MFARCVVGSCTGRVTVWSICLLLACIAAPAEAQTGHASPGDTKQVSGTQTLRLTLEEAIRLALGKSRAALAARLEREDNELGLEGEQERYTPQVGASGSATFRHRYDAVADVFVGPSLRIRTGGIFKLSLRKPVAGPGSRTPQTVFGFSQPLLKGFGTDIETAKLRKAQIQERIAVRMFRDAAAGIVASVVNAWRGVLQARRRVEIARAALERARRQLEVNRLLVGAGRMAERDLVQTEAAVAEKEYALIDSENSVESADSVLANVLDLEEYARVDPREEPDPEIVVPDPAKILEAAFARRADWLRAELGVALARIDLRVAQNNRLPELSLDAEARNIGQGPEADYVGLLNFSVSLTDESSARMLVQARNRLRRAQMTRSETQQSIRIAVHQAVINVAVALRRIDLARRARDLAEQKLGIERLKLRQGLSSSFQVARFEDDLVRAEIRELDATIGYRKALTALHRTQGTTLERWGIAVERVGR